MMKIPHRSLGQLLIVSFYSFLLLSFNFVGIFGHENPKRRVVQFQRKPETKEDKSVQNSTKFLQRANQETFKSQLLSSIRKAFHPNSYFVEKKTNQYSNIIPVVRLHRDRTSFNRFPEPIQIQIHRKIHPKASLSNENRGHKSQQLKDKPFKNFGLSEIVSSTPINSIDLSNVEKRVKSKSENLKTPSFEKLLQNSLDRFDVYDLYDYLEDEEEDVEATQVSYKLRELLPHSQKSKKNIGQINRDSNSPFLKLSGQFPQEQKSPNSIPLDLVQNEYERPGLGPKKSHSFPTRPSITFKKGSSKAPWQKHKSHKVSHDVYQDLEYVYEDYDDRYFNTLANQKLVPKKSISTRVKKWFEGFKIPKSIKTKQENDQLNRVQQSIDIDYTSYDTAEDHNLVFYDQGTDGLDSDENKFYGLSDILDSILRNESSVQIVDKLLKSATSVSGKSDGSPTFLLWTLPTTIFALLGLAYFVGAFAILSSKASSNNRVQIVPSIVIFAIPLLAAIGLVTAKSVFQGELNVNQLTRGDFKNSMMPNFDGVNFTLDSVFGAMSLIGVSWIASVIL